MLSRTASKCDPWRWVRLRFRHCCSETVAQGVTPSGIVKPIWTSNGLLLWGGATLRSTPGAVRRQQPFGRQAVALHLPDGHALELGIAQEVQQSLILLRHLSREFRARLLAHDLGQRRIICPGFPECRFVAHFTPASFLPALVLGQVAGLAVGDHHEDLPEVVAVG